MSNAPEVVEQAFREEFGRILATLSTALERWHRDGVPDNPPAWITTVARHEAIDGIRRD